MARRSLKLAVLLLSAGLAAIASAEVVIYPAPTGVPVSTMYTVTVNGQTCPVFRSGVWSVDYTQFDFGGAPVEVKVTVTNSAYWTSGVKIRPSALNIVPVKSGNTATFTLTKPCKITVEPPNLSGDEPGASVLLLFANPLETNKPSPTDPNVIYMGPGYYNQDITLQSNKTVYLAGGAYVNGGVRGSGLTNATLRGRGVICWTPERNAFTISNSKNTRIEGVFQIKTAHDWTVVVTACDSLFFDNFKALAGNIFQDDGIDVMSCKNVWINDCFVRSHDDVTALYPRGTPEESNIHVSNCVFWPTLANMVRTGFPEYMRQELRNVWYTNCDVIHISKNNEHGSLLSIGASWSGVNNSGPNLWENLNFEDIRYEECSYFVNIYLPQSYNGTIKGLVFKNVTMNEKPVGPSRIDAYDFDVTFENLKVMDRYIQNAQEAKQYANLTIARYPEKVRFTVGTAGPFAKVKVSPEVGIAKPNATIQFAAQALDQNGLSLSPQPSGFSWKVSGGGTINGSGLFTAGTAEGGPYSVIASLTLDGVSNRDTSLVSVSVQTTGLNYRYYEGAWSVLPAFANLSPTKTGIVPNFDVGIASRDDNFAIQFAGFIMIPTDGQYTFGTFSDDGSRISIDGKEIAKNDGVHAASQAVGSVNLSAGMHAIAVEYFESSGGQELAITWKGPGLTDGPIPDNVLFATNGGTMIGPAQMATEIPRIWVKNNSVFSVGNFQACLRIIDARGRSVRTMSFSGASRMELAGLPSGVFQAVITYPSGSRTLSFMHQARALH